MFPSPNSTESDDPLHPSSFFFKSSPNFQLPNDHQNPTAFDDKYNHFFSCSFPSPFFDEHELPLNQILPEDLLMTCSENQPQPQPVDSDSAAAKKLTTTTTRRGLGASSKMKGKKAAGDDQVTVSAPSSRRRGLGAVPRRRTGKKDRHSKISTAQGIRDRRMRLSLQVARKFFDLQDMLGYDKASKTIEWLFTNSKKAIKELIKDNDPQGNSISMSTDGKSESFVSECEVMSGIDQENSNSEVKGGDFPDNEILLMSSKNDARGDDQRKPRMKPNTRESREKARARARCRTREKLMNKGLDQSSTLIQKSSPNCNDVQKLGSLNNPFESGTVDQQAAESGSINQERVSSLEQQMADVGTIEKLLGTSASSSTSCPIADYYCSAAAVPCCIDPSSSFLGFLGNWDLLNNDRDNNISASVQVSFQGKPNSEYSSSVNNNITTTPNFTFYHQ